MAFTAQGIGSVFSGFGAGVNDLFAAEGSELAAGGDFAAAQSYERARGISLQNEQIAGAATVIQESQLQRKIAETVGTQKAATAGANLEGGSAGDLMRMSLQQGALAKTLVQEQGQITRNSYAQQAEAYDAMATSAVAAGNAAEVASKGQQSAGIFSFLGAGIGLLAMF